MRIFGASPFPASHHGARELLAQATNPITAPRAILESAENQEQACTGRFAATVSGTTVLEVQRAASAHARAHTARHQQTARRETPRDTGSVCASTSARSRGVGA